MAVVTGYQVGTVDIGSIFGAKGAHTAATTGVEVGGSDLNSLLLALADGTAVGATGYEVAGADLNTFFGAPASSLPIQGQNFNGTAHLAGSTFSCEVTFSATTSGWTVTSNGGAVTLASGSLPSGAAQVQYVLTTVSGAPSLSNGSPSLTNLSGTALICTSSVTAPSSGPSVTGAAGVTINFANGSGTVISTTTCQFTTTAA